MSKRHTRLANVARTHVALAFLEQLQRFDPARIVEIGLKTKNILQNFRREHPDEIPNMIAPGLLALNIPVDDFSLAIHLTSINHELMSKLGTGVNDPPIVVSYGLANICEEVWPDDDWLASALSYTFGMRLGKSLNSSDEIDSVSQLSDRLLPYAEAGIKFKKGRKIGTVSPLTMAVRRHLKKNPKDSAKQVWEALAKSRVKGMTFYDNRAGRYVEYEEPTATGSLRSTSYRRFSNIVSDQK